MTGSSKIDWTFGILIAAAIIYGAFGDWSTPSIKAPAETFLDVCKKQASDHQILSQFEDAEASQYCDCVSKKMKAERADPAHYSTLITWMSVKDPSDYIDTTSGTNYESTKMFYSSLEKCMAENSF